MPRLMGTELHSGSDVGESGVVPVIASLAPHLATMMQLASPALPIGAFSYSQGLEAAVNAGVVRDEASAGEWIEGQFLLSFLPRELFTLQRAYLRLESMLAALPVLPPEDLQALHQIDESFVASRDSAEGRLEARQLGASLCRWLHSVAPDHELGVVLARLREIQDGNVCSPLAFAAAGLAQGLPLLLTRLAWAFSWLENQVQAAVKLVPLGQSSGQRLLLSLRPLSYREPPDEPWTCAPMASLLMMRHERQYSRLFRS